MQKVDRTEILIYITRTEVEREVGISTERSNLVTGRRGKCKKAFTLKLTTTIKDTPLPPTTLWAKNSRLGDGSSSMSILFIYKRRENKPLLRKFQDKRPTFLGNRI